MKEKNSPGVAPVYDHAVAAVDDGERDREAAERLHQRAGAVATRAPSCWPRARRRRRCASKRCAHHVFERERLDDADALQRLLQGLDACACRRVNWRARDRADAADQLAQHEQRRRRDHEAEAATSSGPASPSRRRGRCSDSRSRPTEVISRLSTCVAAAAPVVSRAMNSDEWRSEKKPRLSLQQLVEQRALVVGDDAVADARQHHAVAVGGERP